MKVLLINGSPHADGCTFTALSEVAKTLETEDIETQIFQIGKAPVRGCIACNACAKLGKCAFDDDTANEMLRLMREADGIVVGSPVYYAEPNGLCARCWTEPFTREAVSEGIGSMGFDAVCDFIAFVQPQLEWDFRLFGGRTKQFVYISSASAYNKLPSDYIITEGTSLANPFWE